MSMLAAAFAGFVLLVKSLPALNFDLAVTLALWTVAVLAALFGLFWGLVNSERRGLILSVLALGFAGLRLAFIEA